MFSTTFWSNMLVPFASARVWITIGMKLEIENERVLAECQDSFSDESAIQQKAKVSALAAVQTYDHVLFLWMSPHFSNSPRFLHFLWIHLTWLVCSSDVKSGSKRGPGITSSKQAIIALDFPQISLNSVVGIKLWNILLKMNPLFHKRRLYWFCSFSYR